LLRTPAGWGALSSSSLYQDHDDGNDDARQYARRKGKKEGKVLFLDIDIAGEPAEPWNTLGEQKHTADDYEKNTKKYQHFAKSVKHDPPL
jgi:hypothetical protein